MGFPTSCDGCGACCEVMLIRFQGRLDEDWCKARGVRVIGNFMVFDYPCQHLKNGRCSIQESKPKACADYKIGCLDCVLCRKLKRL